MCGRRQPRRLLVTSPDYPHVANSDSHKPKHHAFVEDGEVRENWDAIARTLRET